MALPEIKYTKVKTPLFTELAFEDVQMKSEAVQMKSYSDWQGFFKGGCMGEATAPQTGFWNFSLNISDFVLHFYDFLTFNLPWGSPSPLCSLNN